MTADDAPAGFRFGAVLWLTVVLLFLLVVFPAAGWSRAVALGLQGAALLVVVATSGAAPSVRRGVGAALAVATVVVLVLVATRVIPDGTAALLLALITAALLASLVRGVARLVRTHGVNARAVAGALAVYLLVGLIFAWVIALVADVSSVPYFAQHTDADLSGRVYFSFSVLTTTGFGDLTAGTGLGRGLAVLEMLTGQIYLVTVIGVLVGSFVGRPGRS